MDKDLSGKYIPIKRLTSKGSPLATEEQFGTLFLHIKRLLAKMGTELLSGEVKKNPVINSKIDSCAYCAYSPYCIRDGCERKLDRIDFSNIYQKIEGESDD